MRILKNRKMTMKCSFGYMVVQSCFAASGSGNLSMITMYLQVNVPANRFLSLGSV